MFLYLTHSQSRVESEAPLHSQHIFKDKEQAESGELLFTIKYKPQPGRNR